MGGIIGAPTIRYKDGTTEDFYDKFINCLKAGTEFEFENAVVEGDVSIADIYDKIKNDGELLLNEIIEEKGNKIIININISVYMVKVEFKDEFKMCRSTNIETDIRAVFGKDAFFTSSTFEKGANFDYSIFKNKAIFWYSTFGKSASAKFRYSMFEGEVCFIHSTFIYNAYFQGSIFNGNVKFNYSIFLGIVEFSNTTFEGEVDFKKAIFNELKCSESTFKSRAYFENIFFNLLSFVKCGFRDTTSFIKENLTDKKVEELKRLKELSILTNEEIKEIKNYENLAIFNFVRLDEHTTIDNFLLSKTSFLRTDVRRVMLTEYFEDNFEKEKILSHKLLIKSYGNEIYKKAYEILEKQLNNHISVLAEYRNLRLSVEDNITYEEASNLYKMEMELRRKYSKFPENWAIKLYGAISNYGESIEKPILYIISSFILFPLGH